jgi:ribonuclease P protein subunit RPR2
MSGMPRSPGASGRRGRTGRRTALTVQTARERVRELFRLARVEAARGPSPLADRYVALARKVGTRYNVRLPAEFRELCCRSCSAYWVEGRTVRTRLRAGVRVRTCLVCGAVRRTTVRPRPDTPAPPERNGWGGRPTEEPAFVEDVADPDDQAAEAEGEEGE